MKFSATLSVLSLFAASTAASTLFQHLAGNTFDIKLNGGEKIPGESPLEHCGGTRDDALTIHKIDLFPNPPVPGEPLTIKASGTLKEVVKNGAMVEVSVKYGLITLIKNKLDLCEHVSEIDLECPIDPGEFTLTKVVDIPKQIPPGKYGVTANAYLDDRRPITCIVATVIF